jgi:hypothetical protein
LFALLISLLVPALGRVPLVGIGTARADDVTEAAALFEQGNGHFQAGMRARGARRTRELDAALDDYFASLRLVRSRNVLYNAALVLEQLARWDDAFNYWTEYLAVPGLSAAELADGNTHRDALRPRVAVATITSTPSGAEVWIDRRDLAARGHTPLEIALPAGAHTIWLVSRGYADGEGRIEASVGETASLTLTLVAAPVALQVLAPEGELRLDGVLVDAGASLSVTPGPHVLTLTLEGRAPIERRLEVLAGGALMVIDLTSAVTASPRRTEPETILHVEASAPSRVLVDGLVVASGTRLDVPMTPGEHEITVEPNGAPPWSGRHLFTTEGHPVLRLESHPTSDALRAVRGIFGVGAILGVLTSGVLSVAAGVANADYQTNPTRALLSEGDALNLAADSAWIGTAVFGVVAIIALVADDAASDGLIQDDVAEEGE